MELFDPYLTFRLILVIFFAGLILYDLIGLVIWYRGLPRLMQRFVLLKILQVRTRILKVELFLIGLLLLIEGGLMILLFMEG